MRKRMINLIASFLCVVLLTGCGISTQTGEQLLLSQGGIPQYDKKLITVGFIQTGKESDWRDANTNDFMTTFTEENGYNFIYIDGNSSSERQVKAMYDLIRQRVDYIVIAPIVEYGWDEAVKAAYDAKIPVIVTDRNISTDSSLYACWIGSDFYTEGRKASEWLESYLEEFNSKEEEINIVILEGTKGASAALGRTAGLMDQIALHPNWNILAIRRANFTQGEGQTVMEEILLEYNNIDVVISQNDNMMFGAMKAMDRHDISYGVNGEVITISFDALYEAFEKMIDGRLHASVECNPLLADLTENVIKELQQGREVEKVYYSEESIFSYKNAAQYIDERKY